MTRHEPAEPNVIAPATDPVVAMMLAERYGKSLWWKTPTKERESFDDDLICARRRRALVEAAGDVEEESA